MRRFSVLAVLFLLAFPAGLSVIGCASNPANFCNGNTNGPRLTDVATITLEPKLFGISLAFGQTASPGSVQAFNCVPTAISAPGRFLYATDDKTIADVNPVNGSLCGGTFNRNSGNGVPDFSICTPPTPDALRNCKNPVPGGGCSASLTANTGGATSNQVTVFVHEPVSKTSIISSATCDPNNLTSNCCPQQLQQQTTVVPVYNSNTCLSQNQTAQIGIQAFDAQGNNITCSVGHFVFTAVSSTGVTGGALGSPTVVTFDQNGIATAVQPGTVSITATAAGTGSSAGTFTTCPPASISLSGPGNTGTNLTVNLHTPRQLQAKVIDVKGNPIDGLGLTYTSTLPLEIPVSTSTGSVNPAFPSSASVTAACLPPTCNPSPYAQIGFLGTGKPVYSNAVQIHTPGTDSSILYLASTESPSFTVIDFTNATSGTATRLPFVPNSMVLSQDGSTLYFGNSTELMTVSTVTNTLIDQNLNVPGTVLAVSPDNTQLIISDPSRGVFYLYSTKGKTFQTFGGTGTRAMWSPDGTTAYIAGGNAMYIYNTFTGFLTFDASSTGASDVAVTVPAQAGFFAGNTTVARGSCPTTATPPAGFYPIAASVPASTQRIVATNDGNHILGVGGSTFDDIDVTIPGNACPAGSGITIPASPMQTAISVNAAGYTSVVASPDSTLAAVTFTPSGAGTAAIPVYHVPSTGIGSLQNVPLVGGVTAASSAIFSPDGTQIFVGTAGDDRLHVVSVPALADTLQLVTNLVDSSNKPVPADLIAVRPRPIT